jgi:hypothetical protein
VPTEEPTARRTEARLLSLSQEQEVLGAARTLRQTTAARPLVMAVQLAEVEAVLTEPRQTALVVQEAPSGQSAALVALEAVAEHRPGARLRLGRVRVEAVPVGPRQWPLRVRLALWAVRVALATSPSRSSADNAIMPVRLHLESCLLDTGETALGR